jgi:hypothetical protein
MENNDRHAFPDSDLPKNFFEEQHNAILQKTIGIETWQIPGTKAIENCFPVPAGYWLEMEEGVRKRITPQKKESVLDWAKAWYVSGGLITACILVGVLWVGILGTDKQPLENWEAGIRQASREELLHFVETEGTSVEELTCQMASKELPSRDLPSPDISLTEKETEEAIDKIQEEDLDLSTDWNYENNESI